MTRRIIRLVLASICLTMPIDVSGQTSNRQVVVSAAVSLTEVLQQLAPMYQAKTGEQVVLNLGASNTLARQISFGARADVFISADEAQMDAIAARIDPATRVDLLSNQLAIAVPDDRQRKVASARDLLAPGFRRIAIGDPAAVPAGVYAKQYLQTLGIWPELSKKIVPSGSVRLALTACRKRRRRRRGRLSHRHRHGGTRPRGAGHSGVRRAAHSVPGGDGAIG
jgi:molybdate transport system substrate-binding protein